MTARKERPAPGTPVVDGMSMRDIAACLGVSTSRLSICKAVASIPKDELEQLIESDNPPSIPQLVAIARRTPVSARGRVERAFAIYKGMTPTERGAFLLQVGGSHG
jgi:hypothetical protein